jgi:hypothetical protein
MTDTNQPLPLLLFAPCERVVIGSEGDNTASLIALLQGFTVELGELPSPSENAAPDAPAPLVPIPWYVFTLWANDFSGRTFRQRFVLQSPRGRELITGETSMAMHPDKRFHRVNSKLPGFPLDGPGDYWLILSLKTDDGEFVERMRFPIPITSKTP